MDRSPQNDPALTGGFGRHEPNPVFWRITKTDIVSLIVLTIIFVALAGFSHRIYAGPGATGYVRQPLDSSVLWTGVIAGGIGSLLLFLWAPANEPCRYYAPMAIYAAMLFMFDAVRGNDSLVADFGWGLLLSLMARLLQYELVRMEKGWSVLAPVALAGVGLAIASGLAVMGVSLPYRCIVQSIWIGGYMAVIFLPSVMLSA